MANTLQDMLFSVRTALNDWELGEFSPVELIDWINLSQEELIHQLPPDCFPTLTGSLTATVTGTEVTMPTDMHRLLYMTVDSKMATFIKSDKSAMVLHMPSRYSTNASERPLAWFEKGTSTSVIRINPTVSSKSVVIQYIKVPTRVAADADTFGVVEERHSLIVDLTVIKALTSRGKDPSPVMARYKQSLELAIQSMTGVHKIA
jgi:hypothetical protein